MEILKKSSNGQWKLEKTKKYDSPFTFKYSHSLDPYSDETFLSPKGTTDIDAMTNVGRVPYRDHVFAVYHPKHGFIGYTKTETAHFPDEDTAGLSGAGAQYLTDEHGNVHPPSGRDAQYHDTHVKMHELSPEHTPFKHGSKAFQPLWDHMVEHGEDYHYSGLPKPTKQGGSLN